MSVSPSEDIAVVELQHLATARLNHDNGDDLESDKVMEVQHLWHRRPHTGEVRLAMSDARDLAISAPLPGEGANCASRSKRRALQERCAQTNAAVKNLAEAALLCVHRVVVQF